MTTHTLCWRCNAVLLNLILPVSRREECSSCAADQHVCKMCGHFEADSLVQCREERAEPPGDKESANFCDYFVLVTSRAQVRAEQESSRKQLSELFGDESLDTTIETDSESAEFDPEAELKKLFDN
ncbi:MAG: hypothetical protein AB8B48_18230 [Pseudomonadales bacterium]